jgi:hypothetical protein
VTTFTTSAWADPPNAFLDAYRRGDYAEVALYLLLKWIYSLNGSTP